MYSNILSICIGVLLAVSALIGIDIVRRRSKNLKYNLVSIGLIVILVMITMTEF